MRHPINRPETHILGSYSDAKGFELIVSYFGFGWLGMWNLG
jgi:hypothetical protein